MTPDDSPRRRFSAEVRQALNTLDQRSEAAAAQVDQIYGDMYGSRDHPGGYVSAVADLRARVQAIEADRMESAQGSTVIALAKIFASPAGAATVGLLVLAFLVALAIITGAGLGQATDVQDIPRVDAPAIP